MREVKRLQLMREVKLSMLDWKVVYLRTKHKVKSRLNWACETEGVGGTTYVFPTRTPATKHYYSQAIAIGI